MTHNFSVDIIIPTYNREYLLWETLNSVLLQTLHPKRLIIVDSSSNNSVKALIDSYRSKFKEVEIIIDFYYQKKNGVSAARNFGINKATSDYILFLDSDDLIRPSYFAEFFSYYSHVHTQNTVAYTSLELIDEQGNSLEDLLAPLFSYHTGNIYNELLTSNFFMRNLAQVLFPRHVLAKDIRFDESLLSGEDWDFILRVANSNEFNIIDKRLFLFRRHQLNTGNDKSYVFIHNFSFFRKWINLKTPVRITDVWGRSIIFQIMIRLPQLDFYRITQKVISEKILYRKMLFPKFLGNLFLNVLYTLIIYGIRSVCTGRLLKYLKVFYFQRRKYK